MPLFRSSRPAGPGAETRASLESPSVPLTAASLVELYAGARSHAGVHVSEYNAARVIAVYRAWSLIGGTVGSLPLWCFSGDAPGGDRWANDGASLLAYPGGRDEITGIPWPGAPPAAVFYETMMVHLLAWGNAYIVKIPNVARSRTVALDLLMPSMVQPRWVRRTPANPHGKEFVVFRPADRVDQQAEPWQIATPADVIQIRLMGNNLLYGMSPIGAARQALGMAVAAEEFGARLFGSGSLMSGILQTDASLDEVKANRLKERWQAKIAGLAGAHEVAVLDNGAKWAPISMPNKDSQFIESRSFQVDEIARLYGVPPHMLGQVEKSTSWGTGIEQQSLGFNTYTLRQLLTRVEQGLSNELLPRGVNCRFQVSELLRGDAKTEAEAWSAKVNGGLVTPNEARMALGYSPVANGDSLMFPTNYGSLANVVNPPKPPPAPPVPGGDVGDDEADDTDTGAAGDPQRSLRMDLIRGARYGRPG